MKGQGTPNPDAGRIPERLAAYREVIRALVLAGVDLQQTKDRDGHTIAEFLRAAANDNGRAS